MPENEVSETREKDPNAGEFVDYFRPLAEAIDFLHDPTFIIDRFGKVISWNKAIEKMTGISRQGIIGKGDYAYAVPFYGKPRRMLIDFVLNLAETAEGYGFVKKTGDMLSGETLLPSVRGEEGLYLSATASPIYDRDKKLIGAIESIRDITYYKRLEQRINEQEKDLVDKNRQLEDINTALKVLLKDRDDERRKFEDDLMSNIRRFILPHIDKIKKGRLDEDQRTYLELIESSLQRIFSPFIANMNSAFNFLTPTEIQVANLIKEGKTGKEIGAILGIAYKTVETHRYNLRMKLGIQNEKVNLRSYLLSARQ